MRTNFSVPFSARAGSVKRGVAVAGQTVASGTQKVAHGVVTHTKSAADHIQTGIQTSAKVVASVPGSIVNVGAGLIQEGQSGVLEVYDSLFSSGEESQERSPQSMKRERSMATLESLRQKTEQARELSAHSKEILFSSAFTSEEMPSLVRTVGDLTQDQNSPIGTPPDPPYYMTVRLDRRTKKKKRQRQPLTSTPQNSVTSSVSSSFASYEEEGSAFGNKRKREFWYAVPRVHVDAVYHFLLQWRPDKYGKDTTTATIEDASSGSRSFLDGSGKGFIVLDSDADESLA
ncbi:Protein F52E1.13 d, partial [Aphelenchoides avenae]